MAKRFTTRFRASGQMCQACSLVAPISIPLPMADICVVNDATIPPDELSNDAGYLVNDIAECLNQGVLSLLALIEVFLFQRRSNAMNSWVGKAGFRAS